VTEEEAKIILQDLFTDKEVQLHLQRIRRLGKGYWVEPEAKKYIEKLKG